MARLPDREAVYAVADQFRQHCLVEQRSLLWPEHEAWTPANIQDLLTAFIDNPKVGGGSFFEKWRDQLTAADLDVHRIAADVIAFYYLFPSSASIGPKVKMAGLREVISWKLADDVPDLSPIEAAFREGIGKTGIFYGTGRPWQVAFYLEFAQRILIEQVDPIDPAACQRVADEVQAARPAAQSARHIMLHLLFPNEFEGTSSQDHKSRIAGRFQHRVPDIADLAEGLRAIRRSLNAELPAGGEISFYEPTLERVWKPDRLPHEMWAIALPPASIATALQSHDTWPMPRFAPEVREGDQLVLWQTGSTPGLAALATAGDQLPHAGRGPVVRVADIQRFASPQPVDKVRAMNDLLAAATDGSPTVVRLLALEQQAVLAQIDPVTPSPPAREELANLVHMDPEELAEIEELLLEKQQIIFEGPPGVGKTFLAERFAHYFAGVPLDVASDERVEIVQFHQSYSYEDFVQGIRPETNSDGRLHYSVRDGIFKQFCARAARNPEQRFVLIIDEINRGNLSRIFGEILLLLEYRERRVRLPYGVADDAYLVIPQNLYLIGTMNSTDRSLAVMDYALRRRFYFVRMLPVENDRAPVLERWLERNHWKSADRERVLQLFIRLNQRIAKALSPDFQIGHSYFMREDMLDEAGRERVWQRAIMPLLEEYFHSARNRDAVLAQFTLTSLWTSNPDQPNATA